MTATRPDPDFASARIAACFDGAPPPARAGMLALRRLIFDVAAEAGDVGRVEEALRWNQPAYLTPETKAGSTLRLAPTPGGFALYAHCRTTIISSFADAFPGQDRVEGNRALHFRDASEIDPARHGQLVRHALRYHLRA